MTTCFHPHVEIPKPDTLNLHALQKCPACGGSAEIAGFRVVPERNAVHLDLCEHPHGPQLGIKHRILWNVRDEDIDEIVISNPQTVHIEQMDSRVWWIGIDLDNERSWSGNFSCDSRGRMRFTEQDNDGVEWDRDESHDEDRKASS